MRKDSILFDPVFFLFTSSVFLDVRKKTIEMLKKLGKMFDLSVLDMDKFCILELKFNTSVKYLFFL